jgi:hypothetical protein
MFCIVKPLTKWPFQSEAPDNCDNAPMAAGAEGKCHTPVLKSTEPKPPYVCPGCLITRIATI